MTTQNQNAKMSDKLSRLNRRKESAEKRLEDAMRDFKQAVENYDPSFSDSLMSVLGSRIAYIDERRKEIAVLEGQIEMLEDLMDE